MMTEDWHLGALCAQTDPELFFPEAGYRTEAQQAREICGMCEVKQQCLEYAITNREEHGIWGGTSPRERMLMRRPGLQPKPRPDVPYMNGSNWGYKKQCKRGHDLTPENISISASGVRRCRACKVMHNRERAKAISEKRRAAREARYA